MKRVCQVYFHMSTTHHNINSDPAPKLDRSPIFDVPVRSVSFKRREELLRTMKNYFEQATTGRPLIYFLTGLGNSSTLPNRRSLEIKTITDRPFSMHRRLWQDTYRSAICSSESIQVSTWSGVSQRELQCDLDCRLS